MRVPTPVVRVGLTVCACVVASVCPTGESAPASSHTLGDFGPTQTPDEAAATSVRAIKKVTAAGGGVLFLRPDAPKGWQIKNTSQEVWREPSPPAPAKRWGYGPGATVLDTRGGTVTVHPPHMTGLRLERRFAAPEGQGSPHWDSHPMLSLSNSIVRGSTSYRDWLQADVPAGEDRRFYVRTSRDLFPGMFLNTGDHGKVSRLYVKRLGYDRQRNEPYFVADVDQNVAKGAILHNKTHTNLLRMDTYANSENQTFDVMNWRHDYSQGDSYMFEASFNYMSDVHSTAGDENGVLYAAFVRSEITPFRGRVASWSPAARELRYRAGRYAHTLATGRPLINMNPDKWITKGRLWIRAPGGALLGWAGTIRSQDAPWTAEVIGRYLAIDEPDEYVPGSDAVRRWWRITHFAEKDGVKRLSVERHWWGSKSPHGISRLYSYRNFTIHEDQPRLLRYIIAPGANVYDISEGAWPGRIGGGEKSGMVRLAPGPHDGTSVDFGAGDPVLGGRTLAVAAGGRAVLGAGLEVFARGAHVVAAEVQAVLRAGGSVLEAVHADAVAAHQAVLGAIFGAFEGITDAVAAHQAVGRTGLRVLEPLAGAVAALHHEAGVGLDGAQVPGAGPPLGALELRALLLPAGPHGVDLGQALLGAASHTPLGAGLVVGAALVEALLQAVAGQAVIGAALAVFAGVAHAVAAHQAVVGAALVVLEPLAGAVAALGGQADPGDLSAALEHAGLPLGALEVGAALRPAGGHVVVLLLGSSGAGGVALAGALLAVAAHHAGHDLLAALVGRGAAEGAALGIAGGVGRGHAGAIGIAHAGALVAVVAVWPAE